MGEKDFEDLIMLAQKQFCMSQITADKSIDYDFNTAAGIAYIYNDLLPHLCSVFCAQIWDL